MTNNYRLTAIWPLNGFEKSWGPISGEFISVREVGDRSLISLAIPLDGTADFELFLSTKFGLKVPKPGKTDTKDSKTIMGLARDQFFLSLPFAENPAPPALLKTATGRAYITDQSDSWAHLEMTGSDVRMALERICPLNLHPDAFAVGDVARTTMEHLNVIILRTDAHTYHLMSARSSALSFLHAVTTSIENTR